MVAATGGGSLLSTYRLPVHVPPRLQTFGAAGAAPNPDLAALVANPSPGASLLYPAGATGAAGGLYTQACLAGRVHKLVHTSSPPPCPACFRGEHMRAGAIRLNLAARRHIPACLCVEE